ncbi:hypothetical protein FSY59_21905 [Comamonas sp. Z3]|nr:hypothetical protein FSY59_21905 [Comamonas sp. Z3]
MPVLDRPSATGIIPQFIRNLCVLSGATPRYSTLVTAGIYAVAACAAAAPKSKPTTTNLLMTQVQIDDFFILIPI